MKKILFFALLLSLLPCSCKKTDVLYQVNAMMTLEGSVFHADFGIDYQINGGIGSGKEAGRYMVALMVTEEVSETLCNANLSECYRAVDTAAIIKSKITDDKALGSDAAELSQAWVTKGFLNMSTGISYINTSELEHLVRIVYDDVKSNSDTIYFDIRHNAYGESWDNEEVKSNVSIGTVYTSTPISEYFPQDKNEFCITINWVWFHDNGEEYTKEHDHFATTLKIKK